MYTQNNTLCNIACLTSVALNGFTGFSYFCLPQVALCVQFHSSDATFLYSCTKVINANVTTASISDACCFIGATVYVWKFKEQDHVLEFKDLDQELKKIVDL